MKRIIDRTYAPGTAAPANMMDGEEQRCKTLWREIPHGVEPGSIGDAWAEELESLMPVGRPFDGFVEYGKRVSPTCLVHLERNRYSVPASYANRPVGLRAYPDRFVVVAEGRSFY